MTGIRRLLRIIKKKPNSFDKFCDSLQEAHDWLADRIRNTDPGSVAAPDEADGADEEEEKMKQLQAQLWMQTQLIQKFKEEINSLKGFVEEQADENRMIKLKFNELEQAMQSQGVGQQEDVKTYLEDYVHKREHPNRAAIESPDGSSVDAQPQLKRYSMGDPTNLTEAIARHLAVDVVRFMVEGDRARAAPNRYAQVMRAMVTELTTRYHNSFVTFMQKLQFDDISGFATLKSLADNMFEDNVSNWGRIVTLYAFGGYIAKNITGVDEAFSTMIGDFLGFYVTKHLAPWIEENGGWVSNAVDSTETFSIRMQTNTPNK